MAASDLVRYYDTTGRSMTPSNMQWDPVIQDFSLQWKALGSRKDKEIEVPKLSRELPILKFVEAFHEFLSRRLGFRLIPLTYVVRESIEVDATAPPLAAGKPHSTLYGSVEGELVARASHDHPLYRDDNAKVYFYLEEALRGTNCAPSIKPYLRAKDGRAALLAVTGQYAGQHKWAAELSRQSDFLHWPKWKGQNNFTLEMFITQHRSAFVYMTQCAEHVPSFELPNPNTRVGYLLNGIQTSDPTLLAGIAFVESDTAADGKRNDFEATAIYLLTLEVRSRPCSRYDT